MIKIQNSKSYLVILTVTTYIFLNKKYKYRSRVSNYLFENALGTILRQKSDIKLLRHTRSNNLHFIGNR